MKATAILIAALALAGSALAKPMAKPPKKWEPNTWGRPAPESEKIKDFHKLPKCWQHCLQEGNKVSKSWDLNTISNRDFCEDKYMYIGDWYVWHLNPCTASKCPNKAVHNDARAWYRAKCVPFLGEDLRS